MIKLTNTHVAVLTSACQREDGLATRPASLRPAAAAKVAAKLIELGLVREVRAKGDAADAEQPSGAEPAKVGSKRAVVINLLQRGEGATIDDLIAATDWLPHTTRAALSGLRKDGLAIERSKAQRGTASVYRIATTTMSAAA